MTSDIRTIRKVSPRKRNSKPLEKVVAFRLRPNEFHLAQAEAAAAGAESIHVFARALLRKALRERFGGGATLGRRSGADRRDDGRARA